MEMAPKKYLRNPFINMTGGTGVADEVDTMGAEARPIL